MKLLNLYVCEVCYAKMWQWWSIDEYQTPTSNEVWSKALL